MNNKDNRDDLNAGLTEGLDILEELNAVEVMNEVEAPGVESDGFDFSLDDLGLDAPNESNTIEGSVAGTLELAEDLLTPPMQDSVFATGDLFTGSPNSMGGASPDLELAEDLLGPGSVPGAFGAFDSSFEEEEDSSSDERIIPVVELTDALEFYLERKGAELQEYRELMTEYGKVHIASTSWQMADSLTSSKGDSAVNTLMPLLVDKNNLQMDLSTPQGRNAAAMQLAVYTVEFLNSSPSDIQAAKVVKEKYDSEGLSEEVFGLLLSNKLLSNMFNKWLSSFASINRIDTAGQTALKTRQFRSMQETEARIESEYKLFEAASQDLTRVTYPLSIDSQATPEGIVYRFVCGGCGQTIETPLPFYNINLMDYNTVAAYKDSKTPPPRISNMGVVFRGHCCTDCNAMNIIPYEFATRLRDEAFDKIRQGSLTSKNKDPFALGYADVSQSVIASIAEGIREELPRLGENLPNFATSIVDLTSPLLELGDILPEWMSYKQKYWKIVRGAYKLDTFSRDNNLRFYGYLGWLMDKYPSRRYTIKQEQIISYLIHYIQDDPTLSPISEEYDRTVMTVHTCQKLIRVIDELFAPLWGDEIVSTGFIKQGLAALKEYGHEYPDASWMEGLSISQNIVSTPKTEELKKWLTDTCRGAQVQLHRLKDKLEAYTTTHQITGPVRFDNMPLKNDGYVSDGVLAILARLSYDSILVNTMAEIIFEDINCGLFMRGFGVMCGKTKDFVKEARSITRKISAGASDEDIETIRRMNIKMSDKGITPQNVIATLLMSIRVIDSNDLFRSIIGIPVNHLKVNSMPDRLQVPDEATCILRKLFTYNDEYKVLPSIIVDHGIDKAAAFLLSLNPEAANEDSISEAVFTVAKEMALLDPPELWREQEELLMQINAIVD